MTFEAAKITKATLETEYKAAADAMKAFPRLKNGLTPDAIKNTAEWKLARAAKDAAFARLRKFNAVFTRTFAKEIRTDRR